MRPQILELGFFTINGYGLMIAIAIPLCYWLVSREARRKGLTALEDNLIWMFFWVAGAVYLGGKLAFMIGYPDAFSELKARAGLRGVLAEGFVFFGSVIAGVPVTWYALRRYRIPVGPGIDAFTLVMPLGHTFGRLGCFLAGCCFGCKTSSPLAVVFPTSHGDTGIAHPVGGVAVHPVQLYEALGSFLVFLFLWFFVRRRRSFDFQILLTYLLLYAVLRFAMEFFRGDGNPVYVGDDVGHQAGEAPGGLTQAQVISLVMLVVVGPLTWSRWRRAPRRRRPA